MGKRKDETKNGAEMPERLVEFLEKARENKRPTPTVEEEELIPALFEAMQPGLVPNPNKVKETDPAEVWRDPRLMIVWGRKEGTWLMTLTDDVLGVRIGCKLGMLLNAILDAEKAIRSGEATIEKLEKKLAWKKG